jgi:hypothetical protein
LPYSQVTSAQLLASLALRLNDPNNLFWSAAELQEYIKEALRTWQVFSSAYHQRIAFPTVANTLFYDLFSRPELAPTITDQGLMRILAYHLQEPTQGTGWLGTDQFTPSQVLNSIQYRRDRFMVESGMVLATSEVPGPSPVTDTIDLAQSVIDVRFAAWKNSHSIYSPMFRTDLFNTSARPNVVPGVPSEFITFPLRSLAMQVTPPPLDNGAIRLLTTNSGPALDPVTPTILGIPDDFVWVVKWGVLADLFGKEGPGNDPARAAYCESRWKDGINLSRISNFIHLGYLNGNPTFVDSLTELVQGSPNWTTPGVPTTLAASGNMIATGPVANGVYSIGLDIMPSFPVPTTFTGTFYVQIGPEIVDVILDYSEHLAHVKEGAEELQANSREYENLVKLAAVQNDRLRAAATNFDVLSSRSMRDQNMNLRRASHLALKEIDYAN